MTMPPDSEPPNHSRWGILLPALFLALFTAVFTAVVGAGWLRQLPTHEELYGGGARFLFEFWNTYQASGGFPWWSPNFLLGHSLAGLAMCALPISSGLAAVALFGDPVGIKIAALAVFPLSALAMFVFVRRLSGSAWSALAAAILYIVSAQMIARLADFQHWMGSYSYIFPPLILWAFLRIADERSLRAAAWLALAWAGMMLSYTKLAFLFLPLAAAFVLWLWFSRPDSRRGLVLGCLVAVPAVFVMAVVPLLPLVREFRLVAAFDFDPFELWQQSFNLKNFVSVFDRNNALSTGVYSEFVADRGQFYLGACVFLAVAWYLWTLRYRPAWSTSRDGTLFRVFSGLSLLALWLSHGPIPPLDGILRIIAAAEHAKFLSRPVIFAATALPLVFLWTILPRTPRRKWLMAVIVPLWLVIPGFAVLEILPPLRGIRAPWGYWEVGFFSAAVAASAAAKGLFEFIPLRPLRVALGAALCALLVFDMSPYLAKFTVPGLPAKLFEDFSDAQKTLAASQVPGRVLASSSRYFFLRTPLESGRPLVNESSWQHLQLRGAREMINAAFSTPDHMFSFLRVAGASHILSEKKDPHGSMQLQDQLAPRLREVFDSEFIRVQENKESLFPAFTARDYIVVEPGVKNLSNEFLALAAVQNTVPVELGPDPATFPFLAGTAGASTGLFLPPLHLRKPSPPFERLDYSQPRTNPLRMEFRPAPGPGWLVVSEAWHPDWKAFAGHDPVPVYKAFGALMAVPLDRAQEPLRFEFSPPAWYGLCIQVSLAAWIAVSALLVLMPVVPGPLRRLWKGPMENLVPAFLQAEIRHAAALLLPVSCRQKSPARAATHPFPSGPTQAPVPQTADGLNAPDFPGTPGEPLVPPSFIEWPRADRLLKQMLLAALIVLASLWVYSPSYHGDWLWDDDQILLTNPTVQHRVSTDTNVPTNSWATLKKLWFSPDGADYFPLTYTALWAQWPFFGSDSTGYHITTILLHTAGALLVWVLLARMRIPGAWLAGFVFAVHPVCVESVAWVSEIKNTLSLPFFLASCIFWVCQDEEPDALKRQRFYALSIVFFLIAMFAKTSVVAFPVVTLLYAWWKRGKVGERDLLQALPLFAISLVLGLVTISYQWGRAIGQEKVVLDSLLSLDGFLARLAIAGVGILHYLLTIVWPVGLLPIYPRWEVDPPKVWMFLAWPAIFGGIWWMWRNRDAAFPPRWGRHALFAFGFFLLFLAPVLGFVDISYMRITWVADHFIYVPMIGILAFLCAGAVIFFNRLPEVVKPKALAAGAAFLALLAFLAFRYTIVWQNEDQLWEYTLERNNDAWQAHNRLGAKKSERGDLDGAHYHFLNAVRLRPDLGETQNNLATTLLARAQVFAQRGDQAMADQETATALEHLEEACRISPHMPVFHVNLANSLTALGRFQEAGEKYKEILKWDPDNAAMVQNYGIALYKQGRLEEAIAQFRRALEINPGLKDASDSLAVALADQAKAAEQPPAPPAPPPDGQPLESPRP